MNDTKYLFLCGLFPKDFEKEICNDSIGSVQNAANVLQWNIVNGIDHNLPKPISILNSLYIGSYPKRYKKLFIPSFSFSHTENAEDYNVGFCNLEGYKLISRKITLKKALKRWLNNNPGKKIVLAYAMTSVMIDSLTFAKRYCPDLTTCLIVPDLPEYMNPSGTNGPVYRFLKNIDVKKQKKRLAFIDKYVLLTKQMNEKIKARDFMVMEGMTSELHADIKPVKKLEKTILYTGGLHEKYGVVNLVNAFMRIEDPQYKLILCGSGNASDYIKEMQRKDPRIDYRGLLINSEVLELQREATVLINPRQNNEEFTKYSFPSKNLEYMSSGTPVIAYRLDGIPDEYEGYLHYVEDDSIDALKQKIIEVCEQSSEDRDLFGARAKKFVSENKNLVIQAKRILDFLNSD